MGKPTGFLEYKRETAGLPTSMSSGLLSAKKNRKHRGRAAWPAAYLSASQV